MKTIVHKSEPMIPRARGTNLTHAKSSNLSLVLHTIRAHGPLSRTDVAHHTGLTKQTISNLTEALREAKLISDAGIRRVGVGKPSILLQLDPDGAFAIGVQLDRGRLVSVLSDFTGAVRCRIESDYNPLDPSAAVKEAQLSCRKLLRRARVRRDRVLGVGLVMPGPFGVRNLEAASLPGWNATILQDQLEKLLRLPVVLLNDATAAAIGEWLFGRASANRNFCFLYVGIGLGVGIVVNNRPYSGALGNAGELGHLTVEPGGRKCACGNNGCLEAYVSLGSVFEKLSLGGTRIATVAEFSERIRPDDPTVQEWLRQSATPLRTGIQALENLFDPETIVVGGDAPVWFIRAIIDAAAPLHNSVRGTEQARDRLVESELGPDAAARGAAVLPLFDPLNLRRDNSLSLPSEASSTNSEMVFAVAP